MSSNNWNRRSLLPLALVLLALLPACSLGGGGQDATVQALAEALALTATAAAGGELSPQEELETAVAEATAQSLAAQATQQALANLSAEERAATATAVAPIIAELPTYRVDPSRGKAGWIHPPIRLDLSGYMQNAAENEFGGTVVTDFVLSSDITWNTDYGSSGCGYVLRSDGNKEKPDQYMLLATRAALGHVLLATMIDGEFVDGRESYAAKNDPAFDWRNDSTNRLTVVGQGDQFAIFTNGVLINEVTVGGRPMQPVLPPPPATPINPADPVQASAYESQLAQYEEQMDQAKAAFNSKRNSYKEGDTLFLRGFVSMIAISESGHTVCEFNNTWLWLIED